MSEHDSNSKETLETETLGALAEKIVRYVTEADDQTIKAAKLILEARKRVEAGEAGDTTWYEWARNNIKLSESRLRELQRIAKEEDPQEELERLREKTRKRVERHRNKKKSAPLPNGGAGVQATAEMEADRKSLIAWAESAPIDRVTKVLSYARQLDSAEAVSNPDEPAEPAVM
jgi:hypothetical protein